MEPGAYFYITAFPSVDLKMSFILLSSDNAIIITSQIKFYVSEVCAFFPLRKLTHAKYLCCDSILCQPSFLFKPENVGFFPAKKRQTAGWRQVL